MTSYEVVGVFKDVFPAFMNGCKVISSYTHLDRTEELKNITIGVLNTNRVSLRSLGVDLEGAA